MIQHQNPTPRSPSRVVVLGASGFVGRCLLGWLRDAKIDAIGLSSRDVDLRQPESVTRLSKLVHKGDALVFASALTPDKGKDVRTLMRNLAMGEHVAAIVEKIECAHVVYLSSDAVYDDNASLVNETAPCTPSGLYGQMHVVREKMLAAAVQKNRCPLLNLRLCAVFGAGDTHNSYGPNRFLSSALKDKTIKLFGNGEEKRDHIHVEDVARLIGLCLTHRSTGTLNVATGKSLSFYEVARAVAQLCGEAVKLDCQKRSGPITHRHYDITATLRAFPTFQYTSFAAALRATYGRQTASAAAA